MEYLKGELDAQRHQEIRQHLDGCEDCMSEVEQLQAFALDLAEWKGPELSEEAVDSIKAAGYQAFQESNTSARTMKLTIRKALTAAAIIMLTFLFQSLIWNPFQPVIAYTTTLTMVPSMLSIPTADAATSTTLYLTVHPNQMVSTQHLDGEHQLENLAAKLIEANLGNQFETVLIMGDNPEQPIRFETDSLDDLQKDLEIDSIEIGPGLLALEVHDRFVGRLLFRAGQPPYPGTPEFGMQPHSITIDSTVLALTPGVRIVDGNGADSNVLQNLQNPQRIIMGFINDTLVSINHAIIPLDSTVDIFNSLYKRNANISLTIIIPDSANVQDTGFRLADIAREVGIDRVLIKRLLPPRQ